MIENFHPEHHHGHHSMGDPFVQETSKTSEIRDNFGKVRFKVYLIDMLDYYDEKEDCDDRFVVSVYSLCYSLDPYKILEETFNEPSDAYCFYNKCIENYKHIVQVETKDFQDIAIYAEKINYHKIDPDCCANCKYSRTCEADKDCNCHSIPPYGPHHKPRKRLICMNSRLFTIDNNEAENKDCCNDHCEHNSHHGHEYDKTFNRPHNEHDKHHHHPHMSDIQPKVDDWGICDYYEREPKCIRQQK